MNNLASRPHIIVDIVIEYWFQWTDNNKYRFMREMSIDRPFQIVASCFSVKNKSIIDISHALRSHVWSTWADPENLWALSKWVVRNYQYVHFSFISLSTIPNISSWVEQKSVLPCLFWHLFLQISRERPTNIICCTGANFINVTSSRTQS